MRWRPPSATALLATLLWVGAFPSTVASEDRTIQIGSKSFTESIILGAMLTQLSRAAGAEVNYRSGLGGSRVLWNALLRGDIDLYPEYTGTIGEEILSDPSVDTWSAVHEALAPKGIAVSKSLGFDNSYALGMREEEAERLQIKTISDLRKHPELRFGFSNEFMDRRDGWPGLRDDYHLPQTKVLGMEHDLAYRGLSAGSIDVIDLYATDAEIKYYDLRLLEDDLHFFPSYQAVILYRSELESEAPEVVAAISRLEGRISESDMIAMNAEAKLERIPESEVASRFLNDAFGMTTEVQRTDLWKRLRVTTGDQLFLVTVSLAAAICVAVPLGILAARFRRLGQGILAAVGIVQTIPSLALLVFMIPLLGIGAPPAIAALFLYSLLPIVRNTHAGLHDIPIQITESAVALGLSRRARLWLVELPMASRSILAGIKTSAVINVGTATLAALIGAGGYGQPILTGIRLDDVGLIMEGAVPAAGLAILVQGLFELAERRLVSRGLRIGSP